MALVIKTNDVNDARAHLAVLLKQIKKKTPVKFKTVTYKGYEINFLSIKGFFKMILGNRFKEFDKPYFTLIEDFVVFSDNPNTLKTMIDSYREKQTLVQDEGFKRFEGRMEKESSLFAYANTPILYDAMYALADRATKTGLHKNKDFLICFPQVAFQLSPERDLFRSRLVIGYEDVETVKRKFTDTQAKEEIAKTIQSKKITEAVFRLPPIYPDDLTAKSFRKSYASGNVRFEVDLKNGVKHGRYSSYYSNGKKKMSGRFKEDVQVGTWRYFDENGNQVLKRKF